MGCNCGKKGVYTLIRADGNESEHRSQQEAKAELARTGGKGRIEKRVR